MTTKNDIDDLFSGSKVSVDDVVPETKAARPGMISSKLRRHKTALISTVVIAFLAGATYTQLQRDSEQNLANHQEPHVSAKAAFNNMDVSAETEKMMKEQSARMAEHNKKYEYKSNVFRNEQSTMQKKSPELASQNINKIAPTYVKDSETLKSIEKVTDFKVPESLRNNQVSAWMVKHLSSQPDFLENQDAFMLALTMRSEGFVNHVYNDVGYASIGAGQTVGVQSGKSVRERFSSVGADAKTVDFLVGLSSKKLSSVQLPNNYKDFQITGQQGAQVALLHIHKVFHESVKNSVGNKAYETLNHHQKNSLAKISYQKGSIGTTTANAVKEYASFVQKNPNATPDNKKEAFKAVSASYTMFYNIEVNGQKVRKSDENSLRLARMTADAPEILQKEMQGTLTPKEAKSYSAQYQQQYKVNPTQGDIMSVDKNGEVQGYDPMKEYRELGREGKANISVEREIEKKEAAKKNGGWTNLSSKMR